MIGTNNGQKVALTVSSGSLTLSGANSYSGGTNIQGGTLILGASNSVPSSGAVTFGAVTTNGTLDLFGFNGQVGGLAVAGTVPGGSIASQIIGSSGGSGTTSTLTFATGTSTFGGTIKDVIGTNNGQNVALTVSSGSLTLSGADSYSGATAINGGTLVINGSTSGTGAVTVNSGGTLGGNGTVAGAVTINTGGILAPGANLTGTSVANLNLTSTAATGLTLGNSTALTYRLGATIAASDLTTVTNAASLGTGSTVNITAVGGTLAGGAYSLINAGSIVSGSNVSTWTIGNRPAGYSLALGATSTNVSITVAPALVWTGYTGGNGAANSNWDAASTTDFNWSGSGAASNYVNTTSAISAVQFGDTNPISGGTPNNIVTINSTGITPNGVAFTNSLVNYTLNNAAGITTGIGGTTAVTFSGSGTVELVGENSYTGGTTISNGLVIADQAAVDPLSTGLVTLTGGTLRLNGSGGTVQSYVNNISVTGAATIDVRTVLAAQTGSLSIGATTLSLTGDAGASLTTGAVTLSSTTSNISTFNPTGGAFVLSSVAGSASGGNTDTLTLDGTAAGNSILGAISNGSAGALAVTKSNTSTWALNSTSSYSGGTTISGGSLVVNSMNFNPLGSGTVTLSGGSLTINPSGIRNFGIGGTGLSGQPNGNVHHHGDYQRSSDADRRRREPGPRCLV